MSGTGHCSAVVAAAITWAACFFATSDGPSAGLSQELSSAQYIALLL